MKKVLLITLSAFLLYAPFLAVKPIKNYYEFYEKIAEKYECYPIETCKVDFNGDGKLDIFTIVDEPNETWQHYYRLKIFIEEDNQTKEILNIRYILVDSKYRTHVAIFENNPRKELVIYDTINKEKFFFWDGNQLSPIWNGKTQSIDEIAISENLISKAMSMEDEMGSVDEKSAVNLTLSYLFGLYYFVLLTSFGMYFYFQKKLKQRLF